MDLFKDSYSCIFHQSKSQKQTNKNHQKTKTNQSPKAPKLPRFFESICKAALFEWFLIVPLFMLSLSSTLNKVNKG